MKKRITQSILLLLLIAAIAGSNHQMTNWWVKYYRANKNP
jgi:hypothetical protein